ncbi:transglutaminase-like domain-containing protein, partial [Endozoicomonas sp. SESOKO2]|uniref:transglutaminase-like domain-containing protein n=1 Tax=Endozoicomonas sp. SESOKO2 TaxID=2828743 RepID=UPI00214973A7
PLQPTSLDLQNVARAVIRRGDFTEDGLHQCLNQHYRLYLMAAGISLEALPESSALTMREGGLDSELCKWFNQTVSNIDRPWLIQRSNLNSVDEKRYEIRIKADLNDEEARKEIIKMMAQARWQASGLSLEPDQSDDTLTRALYRHWQQRWFDREFSQKVVDANQVFPLTEEEKQTLKLSASRPYLREAEKRIEGWNSNAVRLWPEFWHQMSDLPNRWVGDLINEVLAVGGDKAPERYIPEVRKKQAEKLDRETHYQHLEMPQVNDYKIFNTQNHSSHMYRWWAKNIDVSAKGDIRLTDFNDEHIQGFEILTPEPLPGCDQELILASDQTLATIEMSSKNGQYRLPSLTVNDYIVALRIEPHSACTLVRGRYTGLHTLSIPEAKAEQVIKIAYVVESRKTDRKTPTESRPEPSKRFDACCSEGMKTVLDKLFTTIDKRPREVPKLLRAINDAEDIPQQIEAITDYCRQFDGNTKPKKHNNFFKFLVTQRQGSCRHRVPVFIAFCRYFGIPSRQIDNRIHCFAEYSGDGGQTWEPVDLGGLPLQSTEIIPDFQPSRKIGSSSTSSKKIQDLMKGADLAQQQALAIACGIRFEELNKALETNSALLATNLSFSEIVWNLWSEGDLTSFSMGVSIIELPETNVLNSYDDILGMMPETVKQILSNSDEDQVTELLRSLYPKIIDQVPFGAQMWLHAMVKILEDSCLAKPSVNRFALEVLKSGWLDPLPTYQKHIISAVKHHWLLVRLEGVDELMVEAARCLKKWYKQLLSREKNCLLWLLAYKRFREGSDDAFFLSHCHDGFSSSLECKLAYPSIQSAWRSEPEGIPNIERMLAHHPAFPKLISGGANHRPVIIMGTPFWSNIELFHIKAEALLQRKVENNPVLKQLVKKNNEYEAKCKQYNTALYELRKESRDALTRTPSGEKSQDQTKIYEQKKRTIESDYQDSLKSLEVSDVEQRLLKDLREKCRQAIEQAFSHYLYGLTHSKGSCLTYCWGNATINRPRFLNNYGSHDPSSPRELYAMMSEIECSYEFEKSVKDEYLRQTLNASNALVLKSDELTKIANEFLNSVNLNSIYDSL